MQGFLTTAFRNLDDKKAFMEIIDDEDYDPNDPKCNLDIKYNYTNFNFQKIISAFVIESNLQMCLDSLDQVMIYKIDLYK